jgi:hypothetical protein
MDESVDGIPLTAVVSVCKPELRLLKPVVRVFTLVCMEFRVFWMLVNCALEPPPAVEVAFTMVN